MMQIFVKFNGGTSVSSVEKGELVQQALDACLGKIVKEIDSFVICNGKRISDDSVVQNGATYHVLERLPGGKGGFGSMLRAIGAQIDKTTNRDACRDLSGRRMRDVNNEKNLREWVAKKAERERERERRRKERRERMLAVPHHKFEDPKYDQQKSQVNEGLEDALTAGLEKAGASGGASVDVGKPSRKRKADGDSVSKESIKKACEWLGVDVGDLSDVDFSSDSSSESGDADAGDSLGYPGASSLPTSDTGLHSDSGMGSTSAHASGSEDRETHAMRDAPVPGTSQEKNVKPEEPENVPEKLSQGLLGELAKVPPTSGEMSDGKTTETQAASNKAANENKQEFEPVDLDEYDSAVSLEALGLDRLKADLMRRGLKCGGTLQERAGRLFAVKGLSKEEIDPSFFAKPSKGKGKKK